MIVLYIVISKSLAIRQKDKKILYEYYKAFPKLIFINLVHNCNLFIYIKSCPEDSSGISTRSLDRGYRPFDLHLQCPAVTDHCRLQSNYLHCGCEHVIRLQYTDVDNVPSLA
jgi:hypothetical protein